MEMEKRRRGHTSGAISKMVEDVERMTQAAEDECPVALKVGSVRHGVAEGIVWVEETLVPLENPLRVKSKRPKHMIAGKKIPQSRGPVIMPKRRVLSAL